MTKPPPKNPGRLLKFLVKRFNEGVPTVCTYSFVSRHILGNRRWARNQTEDVLKLSRTMPAMKLKGLGKVYLDAFIVRKSDAIPGRGHWSYVKYTVDRWKSVLGKAEIFC